MKVVRDTPREFSLPAQPVSLALVTPGTNAKPPQTPSARR